MKKLKDISRKKLLIILIMLCGLILLISGVAFAIFNVDFVGNETNQIVSSGYTITYTEGENSINSNIVVMSDSNGIISGNDFTFSINATSNKAIDIFYRVYAVLNTDNTISNTKVKYYLQNLTNSETSGPQLFSNATLRNATDNSYYLNNTHFSLRTDNLNQTHNYKLTIWGVENPDISIDSTSENKQTGSIQGKQFKFKINVEVNNSQIPYNLTVNPNGGIYDGKSTNTVYVLATDETQSISLPTRNNYIFAGWTLVGTGSNMTSLISNSTFTMGTSEATLTATWTQ